MFLVVLIQEIVSTTPNRSGGNELQLITKMPMCNIEMGFFMGLLFKSLPPKKPVITNHLDDEGNFLEFWVSIFCLFQLVLVRSFESSYEWFGVWDFRRLFLFGS